MAAGVSALAIGLVTLFGEVYFIARSESCVACTPPEGPREELGDILLQLRSSEVSKSSKSAKAAEILPEDLHQLCVQVFHEESECDKAIEESQELQTSYAGVPVVLRILGKDNAAQRLGDTTEDGKGYGLDDETLLDARQSPDDMVNMVDLGGNYGAVTIAVYKKFPGLLRTVIVEPVAPTYFFMRWNLHLNEVPSLTKDEFTQDRSRPGVVALFGGVTKNADQDLLICAHPEWSMNAHIVEKFDEGWGCNCKIQNCTKVPRFTAEGLLDDFFGDSAITLMKLDCEGCEFETLPVLDKHPSRVKRLIGELHLPEEHLIDTACRYDNGKYMTKVCKLKEGEWGSGLDLECNRDRKICRPENPW